MIFLGPMLRVKWLYLRLVLLQVGFHLQIVSWIMPYVRSFYFAFFINGSATPFFKPIQWLKQGCHLAPLFLLVVEGIGILIHQPRKNGTFKWIHVGEHIYISHLFFVHDILIFHNGCRREIMFIQEFLDLFATSTGMVINVTKSSIYILNINEEEFS